MKTANAIGLPQIERSEKKYYFSQASTIKRTDSAQSDVGVFVLLTLLLVVIGRFMGSWVLNEHVKIQKGPDEFVSRAEEYQNLHNQVGLNSFFRMY